MTFRARLLAGFLIVVVTPLALLMIVIPREMKKRFTVQYAERVSETAARIRERLAAENATNAARLSQVASGLREDNVIRRALLSDVADRDELLDYASRSMLRTGLSMLQIQNDSGRILSSGHFRNEFDRVDEGLPAAMRAVPGGVALVRVRMGGAPLLAIAQLDTLRLGGRSFSVLGGTALDDKFVRGLSDDMSIGVTFAAGDSSARVIAASDSIAMPFIDATGDSTLVSQARIYITHSTTELDAAIRDVRIWIIGTILVAIGAALAAALWMASWLSKPLTELATESAQMDLDNPRSQFAAAKRDDEVGMLARRLSKMVDRMRATASRLNDAERRATVGEVARQVNHDIKNGLTPIRNVVRHLAQAADTTPAELPVLFRDRRQTLESSIEYLDALARNYARLSPRFDAAPCDIRPVVEDVARGAATRGSVVKTMYGAGLTRVLADAAVLRRILENLVGNAVDALEGKPGEVTVSVAPAGGDRQQPMIRIVVSDTGRGMTPQELQKAFDDFYSTKSGGTGLGLSVVRRLVADLSGILRVETTPGKGTQMIVDIPAAVSPPRSSSNEAGLGKTGSAS